MLGGLPRLAQIREGKGFVSNIVFGTPEYVKKSIEKKISDFDLDEILIQDLIAEQPARLRSYELLKSVF
jgi:hypothetical protein